MNPIKSIGIIFLEACCLCSSCVGLPPTERLQQDATREMKAGNWEEAHGIILMELRRFGDRDLQVTNPNGGWFWCHRGYCEIKLGMFDDAMKSFEECYTTSQYGSTFLKIFPESRYTKVVRHMILTSLFYHEEYEKCLEAAESMLPNLPQPSKEHATCLFVLGGCQYHLAKFREAQLNLNLFIETYQGKDAAKPYSQAASYYQAANTSRLKEWSKSGALLDHFLKDHPDPKTNPYYPHALFDRATCHFAKGQNHAALAKLTRILEEFPNARIIEETLTLKGNVLESLQKPHAAEQCYMRALLQAEQKEKEIVAAECLFYLVAFIGKEPADGKTNPRLAEALPYYNHFWKHYGNDSPFNAKVAVAGIPAMRKAGKIDEALARLQSVIAKISTHPDAPGIEEAIGSYVDEYLKENTAEELKEHFFSGPSAHSRDITPRAVMRMAIIDAYEKDLEAKDAQAIIKVLFNELRSDFPPKDLPNFVLIRVGDHIRKNTDSPESSGIYYQELLGRSSDQRHRVAALLGLAKVRHQGNQAQKNNALLLLQKIIDDSQNTKEQEEALYLTASIHLKKGDYDQAVASAKEYLKNPKRRQYRFDIRLLLASAYDQAGRIDDALSAYQKVWISSMRNRKYTMKAMERWMVLLWDRNQSDQTKSDRQIAYEGGFKFITMTAAAIKKATPEEKKTWDRISQLVSTYEASPDTMPIGP